MKQVTESEYNAVYRNDDYCISEIAEITFGCNYDLWAEGCFFEYMGSDSDRGNEWTIQIRRTPGDEDVTEYWMSRDKQEFRQKLHTLFIESVDADIEFTQ